MYQIIFKSESKEVIDTLRNEIANECALININPELEIKEVTVDYDDDCIIVNIE